MAKLPTPGSLLNHVFPPMLATAAERPPADASRWVLEPKYDGFRAICAIVPGQVAIWSRNRTDLAAKFPRIAEAFATLGAGIAVVDGEIVALDETGRPSFHLVQRSSPDAFFVGFDLLWLDSEDLRKQPLETRRSSLEGILRGADPSRIRIAERLELTGEVALDEVKRRGIEGVVAKRLGSRYEGRRSEAWLKIRAWNEQEFVVVGFTHTTRSSEEVGALLLGYREGQGYRFAGSVGTGFTLIQRRDLARALGDFVVKAPTVAHAPQLPGSFWVEPRLVVQVRFMEWTSEGMLRHPSLVGFRSDKQPEEVVREVAGRGTMTRTVEVKLTTPDRVLWPRDDLSKQHLADYYDALSAPIIRALGGRPVALEHWNEGIDADSWYQQDVSRDEEEWMTIVETPLRTKESKKARHLVVDRPETLRWIAQRSVITIHAWSSRVGSLESPDWVIIDLDPAEGEGIAQAVDAALVFRRLLDQMEVASLPKTSGKRGIHIMIPLAPGHSHRQAAAFAERVCAAVASRVDFITVERAIDRRKGRLYADALQNAYGKTIVAPYSPRGVDGAPVSAPLRWTEVTKRLDPGRYNLRSLPKRIDKVGDLFGEAMERGVSLPSLR